MPEKVNLNAYFERIGFAGSIAPTLATLELLHALHPAVIPFENLDPLLGLPVRLDQASLERKLLAGRGGYCFEHNLLFMRELAELDYKARPLLARVLWGKDEGAAPPPPSHLLVLVEINKQNYIADVGFGGLTLTTPLRLRADVEQSTPHETFRLSGGDPEWLLEVRLGEDWRPVYTFTLEPVDMPAIEALNAELATGPASPFPRELRVSLSPSGRRLKLRDAAFTIQPVEGEATRRLVADPAMLRAVLTEDFGLVLPEAEGLDARLTALLPPAPPPEPPAPVP